MSRADRVLADLAANSRAAASRAALEAEYERVTAGMDRILEGPLLEEDSGFAVLEDRATTLKGLIDDTYRR